MEIECLKSAEGKRVLDVVEDKAVLAGFGPSVQPLLQLTDDAAKIRNRPLLRLQHVNALDRLPERRSSLKSRR